MKYVISFKSKIEEYEVKKPKWWQFWKHTEVISHKVWKPFSIVVSEDELNLTRNNSTVFNLLIKSLTGESKPSISDYITEELPHSTGYISTEHKKKKDKIFKN